MGREFDALIGDYLSDVLELSPVSASILGIDGYDHRLDDLSARGFAQRDERVDHWLGVFGSVPDDGLGPDQRIDRDLILSALKGQRILRDWESHKRDPTVYLGPALHGIFVLFLHRLHPEEELAAAATSRLEQVPRALEEGKANLDPSLASPLSVERGLGQCRAGVHYFRELVPGEVEGAEARESLAGVGEQAARALEDFGEHLEKLVAEASGEWAIGEERYSALLTEKEMLGYGAREMHERGRAAFEELSAEMSRHAEKMSGTSDWRAVLEELKEDHPDTHDELRDEYEYWTEKARQYLIDRDLVTMPEGERCLVEPSPPFQRPVIAVASYHTPPPFKPTKVGHFFVPYPPEGTPPEQVRKMLESSRHNIPTTSVHEAYPGHHWHLVTMNDNPRRIRRVVRTSYFVEGWALYAEKMMREEGFFDDDRRELCHLEARIFRAARIIIDTALHTGEMSHDEAVKFLLDNFDLPEPTARTEVARYCSWPTQAPSYLTGSLEIERMRERYFAEGRGDLKSFNDTIASSGGLPIALAEQALFE